MLFSYPPQSVSVSAADLTIQYNNVSTKIARDTSTPADNRSLPVINLDSSGVEIAVATTTKQDEINTTLASILAKIIAAPATESKQDSILSSLSGLLTELEKKSDLSETQPVSLASLPLPSGAATLSKQDEIIERLTYDVVDVISPIDINSNNIPASSDDPLEIISATTADVKKIQTIEDVGEFIGLYSGAATSEVLIAILPIAGGVVEINIPSGTRLSIKSMNASAITSTSTFAANLIG